MSNVCPYCHHTSSRASCYPPTRFNQKLFHYLKCPHCKTIFLSPFPGPDDFEKMYPKEYQNGIDHKILQDNEPLPGLRFSYGEQFSTIEKHLHTATKTILDYGCGNGNFVVNALSRGYACDGVEYGTEQVAILQKELTGSAFFTPENFQKENKLYDVIRVSNVIEHLTDPHATTVLLYQKLKPGGILLVEGPLENNFTLSLILKKTYFRLKKTFSNKPATHAPTHITFTNYKSQENLFQSAGFHTVQYQVVERAWPSPARFNQVKGIKDFFKYLQAAVSINFSRLNKHWGNTFLYAGKKS